MKEAVDSIIRLAYCQRCHYVVTPNSDHIIQLEKDHQFQAAYREARLVLADGMPIVWASWLLGSPLKERVTGADLLPLICEKAARKGLGIFLLGAPEGVALKAAERLQKSYPGLSVSACYSPPFGFEKDPEECQKIVKMINDSQAKIVFVGLGAPKQEYWMYQHYKQLHAGVLLGVGAAIEFAAGVLPRAPVWMQKIGFEWFYRLLRDPKRLARRYARDFKIIAVIWRQWRLGRKQ